MSSIVDDIIDIKELVDRLEADNRRSENPFGDLYLCECCGSFIDAADTEDYFENHGPGHSERLSRTTCCRSSFTDVDGQAIVDELGRIRDLQIDALGRIRDPDDDIHVVGLNLITRDNIDRIQVILETVFDL